MTTPEKTVLVCCGLIGAGAILEVGLLLLLASKLTPSPAHLVPPSLEQATAPSAPASATGWTWLFLTPLGILTCLGLLTLYWLPTLIAGVRRHQSWMAIAALNGFGTFFLGMGWFPALLWSLAGVWSRESVHPHYHHALSPEAERSSC